MKLIFPLAALAFAWPTAARAQLRPLDPTDWRMFTEAPAVRVELGAGAFDGQRASLAGTEGTLVEAGNFRALWRTGRVVFEASGTAQRIFHDERRFAEADAAVTEPGPDRNDSGDYRIATLVRLTPEGSRALGILRFGTRIPTTDNRVGLDRDATDFFALLGGRVARGAASLAGEAGVSINTTRRPDFEQDDLFLYAVRAEYDRFAVVPSLTFTGQQVGSGHREIRGNESLGEARLGLRVGRRRWVRVEGVAGTHGFGPNVGVLVAAGWAP
ncbi:MAG TPA: hypothetical protein VE913_23625 [Longimicrobium sp.]|nr:hypothetical protein [Longimicrobium sp.]